jgi:hypothetical protein
MRNYFHHLTCVHYFSLIFLCTLVLAFMAISESWSGTIIPRPQVIKDKGFTLAMDDDWVIVTDINDKEYEFCATWLINKLVRFHSLNMSIIPFEKMPSTKKILLGNPNKNEYIAEEAQKNGITFPSTLGEQGYTIDVISGQSEEILILADTQQGSFYGIQTLLQIIAARRVQGVSIVDYPDHQIRAVDMGRSGSTKISAEQTRLTEAQKTSIDYLAGLKVNMLAEEDSTRFFNASAPYMTAYKELVDYCKQRYIDFVPMIGSLRNNSWVPFELSEGWWIKDEIFSFGSDNFAVAEYPMADLLADQSPGILDSVNLKETKWNITGVAYIDTSTRYSGQNSLKIESGQIYIKLPVRADSHYQLSAYVKGTSPVISVSAFDKNGVRQFCQSDYSSKEANEWTKVGIIIKSLPDTVKVVIAINGRNKPVWVSNLRLWRIDGALRNVIRTKNTDIQVTSLNKTETFILGTDYVILNGEISKKYDERLEPFKIKRIPSGRILPGEKVLISYDALLYWALTHPANQPPCVSDDKLYSDYYYPAIDRVVAQLKPKIINFASDEIRGFNRDSRSRRRGITNAQLFAEWVNKIAAYVKSKDSALQVMIWDDMVSPYHNGGEDDYQLKYGGSSGRIAETIEKEMIDKSIIMNSWWYSNRYYASMVQDINLFESKGFSYFGAAWNSGDNIRTWSELMLKKQRSKGGWLTNWGESDNLLVPQFADEFWKSRDR